MSFIPVTFFVETAIPPMITGAAVIGITTLSKDPDNYLTSIINNEKKNEDQIMKIIEITTACKECVANSKMLECTHKSGEAPAWHNQEKVAQIQKMMGNDTATFARETMGLQQTSESRYYSEVDIERARKNLVMTKFKFNRIFTSFDPSACGKGSKASIVSFAWVHDRMIVSLFI